MKSTLLLVGLVLLSGCSDPNAGLIQDRLMHIGDTLDRIADDPPELRYSLTVCDKILQTFSYKNTVNERPIVILNVFDSRKKEGDLFIDIEVQKFLDRYRELATYCDFIKTTVL